MLLAYHACAPKRYKKSIVSGTVHRILHASSTWEPYHLGKEKLKTMLERNQYPPDFYNLIIKETIDNMLSGGESRAAGTMKEKKFERRATLVLQYRGSNSDKLSQCFRRLCGSNVILMTHKLNSRFLPSSWRSTLSSAVELFIKCNVQVVLPAMSTRRYDTWKHV